MTAPHEHVCPFCETTCDDVTELKRDLAEAHALVAGMLVTAARLGYWANARRGRSREASRVRYGCRLCGAPTLVGDAFCAGRDVNCYAEARARLGMGRTAGLWKRNDVERIRAERFHRRRAA